MSDSRTDREELAVLLDPIAFDTDEWPANIPAENIRMSRVDNAFRKANAILAAGFTRSPRAATVSIAHPLPALKAAFDVWLDLGILDPADIETTDYEVLHLPSNVNFVPTDEHLTDDLRPDIGDF